jgi:CRP-like cAMP-binding protein
VSTLSGPITSKNRILAALSDEEYQRLLPHLEPVTLEHAAVLYEIEEPIEYLYFPYQAIISLVTQMEDGRVVEVALVGREGMSGLAAMFGQPVSAERAIVQIPNGGVRARTSVMLEEFNRHQGLHKMCLSYANSLMRQISQTAACNASHTVEERLARWLLMCQDRVDSNELNLTQEFIAEMLGTRRATVNVAAVNLQSAGLIKYNRGRIRIVDLQGLGGFTCECYEVVKKEFARDGN